MVVKFSAFASKTIVSLLLAVKDVDSLSDNDGNDEDNSVPDDFADVCPYWKLPPENTAVNAEYVNRCYPKFLDRCG